MKTTPKIPGFKNDKITELETHAWICTRVLDRVKKLLDEYKSGNISLGKLAENLDISCLEALNLVAKYGSHPDMPEDYLVEARESARALFRRK